MIKHFENKKGKRSCRSYLHAPLTFRYARHTSYVMGNMTGSIFRPFSCGEN